MDAYRWRDGYIYIYIYIEREREREREMKQRGRYRWRERWIRELDKDGGIDVKKRDTNGCVYMQRRIYIDR